MKDKLDTEAVLEEALSENLLDSVLTELLQQAKKTSVESILVGHPNKCCYQYSSEEDVFRGKIDRIVYESLEKELSLLGNYRYFGLENTILARAIEIEERLVFRISEATFEPIDKATSQEVVFLDCDPTFSHTAREILRENNFRVRLYSDPFSALKFLKNVAAFSGILVCHQLMQGMDGRTMLSELKKLGIKIPTIVLCSEDDELLETQIAELNGTVLLRKDKDPEIFLSWVKNCLGR